MESECKVAYKLLYWRQFILLLWKNNQTKYMQTLQMQVVMEIVKRIIYHVKYMACLSLSWD
jgi:hypothetical protein